MPRTPDRSRKWARLLLAAAAVLAGWALAIAITDGVRMDIGPIRISSRNPTRVLLLALLCAAVAWRAAYRDALEAFVLRIAPRLERLGLPIAVALAAVVLIVGVTRGSRAAAGSDAFGYVSQSALWSAGALRHDVSFAASLPWPEARQTFTPLGYRVGDGGMMVPTYAPGVPLLMAGARTLTSCGPYLVGPASAALLVLFTFLLGRPIVGPAPALAAAALVACSPVVLFMALQPMADVPAAACWLGALATAVRATPRRILLSGMLAGVAVLVRPNLAPLAVFPWLIVVVSKPTWRERFEATALFAALSVPAAIAVGWINDRLYGSPLTSGYGALAPGFSLDYAPTNATNYAAWWLESQGPLALLFVFELLRPRHAARRAHFVLIAFAAAVVLLYLFYLPFDAWWYLRFLIPAAPILLLLCARAVFTLPGSQTIRTAALVAFVILAGGHAVQFIETRQLTTIGAGEERYVEPALHIASTTPRDAVILAWQHSGSIRYYSGRLTLRWDNLDPAWLDRALAELEARGIATYLLLEYFEEEPFRTRFAGQAAVALLDVGPVAIGRGGEQRLYSLKGTAERPEQPITIPPRSRTCLEMSPDFFQPAAVAKIDR